MQGYSANGRLDLLLIFTCNVVIRKVVNIQFFDILVRGASAIDTKTTGGSGAFRVCPWIGVKSWESFHNSLTEIIMASGQKINALKDRVKSLVENN